MLGRVLALRPAAEYCPAWVRKTGSCRSCRALSSLRSATVACVRVGVGWAAGDGGARSGSREGLAGYYGG